MKRKSIVLIMLAIIMSFSMTGCLDFDTDETPKVEIVGEVTSSVDTLYGGYYTVDITGIIKNISGKQLTMVMVEYKIFDDDANQIGTCIDSTTDLAAGGTWKFKASGISSVGKPTQYKLSSLTGI